MNAIARGAFLVLPGLCLVVGSLASPEPLLKHLGGTADVLLDERTVVRRMDVDVTCDGQPDLLLTFSRSSLSRWFVYQTLRKHELTFLGTVYFIPGHVLVECKPPRFVMAIPKTGGTGEIVSKTFDGRGFVDFAEDESEVWDQERFQRWQKEADARVLRATLDDVMSSPSPEWTDVYKHEAVPDVGGLLDYVVVEPANIPQAAIRLDLRDSSGELEIIHEAADGAVVQESDFSERMDMAQKHAA